MLGHSWRGATTRYSLSKELRWITVQSSEMRNIGEVASGRDTLLYLPDEIIHAVLSHLPLKSLVACQSTCTQLAILSKNILLWKNQCQLEYRLWHPRHNFEALLRQPAGSVDWERLLKHRKNIDRNISIDLESVLATSHKRINNIRTMVRYGDDARELLQRRDQEADGAVDILARKYWIKETLGCLDRLVAVQEWQALKDGQDVPLERVFGALDICIAEGPVMTLDELSYHLDMLAESFLVENPNSELLRPAQKASAAIAFLRSRGFRGLISEANYRDLQNNLLSVALLDSNHHTLPLMSVILFCCVARRIGLNAHPCGMPFHMRAVILHPDGDDNIFFDPYYSAEEVSILSLREELSNLRVPLDVHRRFLGPADIKEMIQRAAGNIQSSLRLNHAYTRVMQGSSTHPDGVELSPHGANNAVAIIQLLFGSSNEPNGEARNMQLHPILSSYVQDYFSHFKHDTELVAKYLIPSFGPGLEATYLEDILDRVRNEDEAARVEKKRQLTTDESELLFCSQPDESFVEASTGRATYRVGTLFRHKRYRYMAIIAGWDYKCEQRETWIEQMGVDKLPGGRTQSFYHSLVEDESIRYVAEENIEPVLKGDVGPSAALLRVAGRFFKRWDPDEWKFVSNVQDEYPQD